MKGLNEAKAKILAAKNILISGHINPDGDSIGSILSLGMGIERLGKTVQMVSVDGVPKRYKRLPGAERIIAKSNRIPDLAISVDCGDKRLLGNTLDIFMKTRDILEIDHHEFRKPYGNLTLIDHDAAAVGELIYLLLEHLNVKLTKDLAQNILTSIIVETNSFRLPNIRPLTFKICAELIKVGVDFYNLVDTIFWAKSRESALLLGICLTRCQFIKNEKIVWSIIKEKDFREAGGKDEDVDPVVDEMRSIKNVQAAVFFREKKNNLLRVSMRSKGDINVAAVAEKFDGGGHFDAAGCHIPNDPRSVKKLLNLVENIVK